MCGIVGYVGPGQAREKIIEGLKKLEYRGYDSAGVAVMDAGNIVLRKHTGDTANLEKIIENEKFNGNVGIGHTRWATHGVPSDVNAHPHMSRDGKIAIVHNGTIENYAQIRERLKKDYGIKFKSDTDSEVAAQLLAVNYKGDLHKALKETAANFRGSFVIAAVSSEEPDKIVATRRNAPLIAGEGSEGNFIASDVTALMKYAKDVYQLENDDTLVMSDEGIKIYDADGNPVTRQTMEITWDEETAEKEGYEHFMLKEIYEQPKVLSETLHKRLLHGNEINLDGINLTKEDIDGFNKVYIVACGTAYHAGLVGKNMIEKLAKVPVEVDVASEFKYRDPYVDDKTLFIAVTQSGETLDTLEALREAKRKGARVLSVVNAVGSTVPRESDDVFYTWAGPEIAVASTKAYTTQLMCMYLIALYMGKTKGVLPQGEYEKILKELKQVPDKLEGFLADVEAIKKLGKKFSKKESMF